MHAIAWLTTGFIAQVGARNKSGKPVLLICDGHGSHTTDIMLLKAREHNIYIFRLPPHCTHKLQPLDVGILGPLQSKFSENVDAFVTRNGYGVGKQILSKNILMHARQSLLISFARVSSTAASVLSIPMYSQLKILHQLKLSHQMLPLISHPHILPILRRMTEMPILKLI